LPAVRAAAEPVQRVTRVSGSVRERNRLRVRLWARLGIRLRGCVGVERSGFDRR
jgi:hypothetical protein